MHQNDSSEKKWLLCVPPWASTCGRHGCMASPLQSHREGIQRDTESAIRLQLRSCFVVWKRWLQPELSKRKKKTMGWSLLWMFGVGGPEVARKDGEGLERNRWDVTTQEGGREGAETRMQWRGQCVGRAARTTCLAGSLGRLVHRNTGPCIVLSDQYCTSLPSVAIVWNFR